MLLFFSNADVVEPLEAGLLPRSSMGRVTDASGRGKERF